MKTQLVMFIFTLMAVTAGSQVAHAGDGHYNPVLLDACVMVTPSDLSAMLGATTCASAGDYPRWTCQFENFFYHEDDTLYFAATNKTVTQKTLEWLLGPFSAVGATKEAAFNRLESNVKNQLETQVGEADCAGAAGQSQKRFAGVKLHLPKNLKAASALQ